MPRVILQPAAGTAPQRHYHDTIERTVPLSRVQPFVPPALLGALQSRYAEGGVRVWGAVPGPMNLRHWERMEAGDTVLFYAQGMIYASLVLTLKTRNRQLAAELWGSDSEGRTWELMFFLDDPRPEEIPYGQIWEITRYGPPSMLRGLVTLSAESSEEILERFNLSRDSLGQGAAEEALRAVEAVRSRAKGQGIRISAEARRAVENHAMVRAKEAFKLRGYAVEDVHLRASYDLRCTKGDRELLVEVKGTQTPGEEVLLTPNEVSLARNSPGKMALFVLHSVVVNESGGRVEATGGTERLLLPWDIRAGQLEPVGYSYRVPPA